MEEGTRIPKRGDEMMFVSRKGTWIRLERFLYGKCTGTKVYPLKKITDPGTGESQLVEDTKNSILIDDVFWLDAAKVAEVTSNNDKMAALKNRTTELIGTSEKVFTMDVVSQLNV